MCIWKYIRLYADRSDLIKCAPVGSDAFIYDLLSYDLLFIFAKDVAYNALFPALFLRDFIACYLLCDLAKLACALALRHLVDSVFHIVFIKFVNVNSDIFVFYLGL